MNVLSWNCRGLGKPRAVQTLRRLVRTKKPNLVFLMETKQVSKFQESVRVKLGFEANFVVDSIGRSGGLAWLWNLETKVEVQNFSRRHINATVLDDKTGKLWNFTGFYGNMETARRSESWAILRFLAKINPAPWLCVGDFNEITNVGEKSSSSYKPPRQMQEFKKVLEDCQLLDLGFEGPRFTWCNDRYGASDFTRERLDRAMANDSWVGLFDMVEVQVLPRNISDHNPLLVSFSNSMDIQWSKSRMFRYEPCWAKQKDPQNIIKQVWKVKQKSSSPWDDVQNKLLGCKQSLKKWVRKSSCPMEAQIRSKEQQLRDI
jgi:hypothetical protein